MQRFKKRSLIHAPAQAVFDWHKRSEAVAELTPPWEPVTLQRRSGGIEEEGSEVVLRLRPLGAFIPWVYLDWLARHEGYKEAPPVFEFTDRQIHGPFAYWCHTHRAIPESETTCWLEDAIDYQLPLGALGEWVAGWYVRRKLQRLFNYRHAATTHSIQKILAKSPD